MTLRVAINGFGRIGRNVLRAFFEKNDRPDITFVAINDLGSKESLLHLLRYDTTHGRFAGDVSLGKSVLGEGAQQDDVLQVNGSMIRLLCQPDPEQLPWGELGVDVVLECTGEFRAYDQASRHLKAGAARVIIGAAPFDRVDAMPVFGVNHESLRDSDRVLSSVSCTTHALLPLVKILDEAFGIESGLVTEIHAVTSDQMALDHVHRDLRRARAAGQNIIPTTSSAIGALRRIMPEMAERIDGYSVRVPTLNVACLDFSFVARQPMTAAAINELFREKSQADVHGVLGWCDEPLVSSDFNHQSQSLIFDATETRVVGRQAKVLAWYDNEWGYANRLIDLCGYLAAQARAAG